MKIATYQRILIKVGNTSGLTFNNTILDGTGFEVGTDVEISKEIQNNEMVLIVKGVK